MFGIALQFINGGFTRALSWATANAGRMLAIALACALIWGLVERNGRHKAERVLASTERAYRNAQADAKLAQDALNARQVATNEAVNKGSTNAVIKDISAARSAVAAYVRMHPAPRCPPRETNPSAVSANPGVDAGAGGEAGMAAIAVADLDILAAGTVRAEGCRAWGAAMIDAGLAEAGD